MTEHREDAADMLDDPEIELITDWLTGQLPQERIAEVAKRIDEDPAFRALAAPLVTAWTVKPHWERHPMPSAKLQRHWDEFTRRAGFVHQRRRARRRRIVWLAVTALALSIGYAARQPLEAALWRAQFTALPASSRAPLLRDGSRVILEDGAVLDVHRTVGRDSMRWVRLRGEARFILPRENAGGAGSGGAGGAGGALHVLTRAGVVRGITGEFRVRAIADTTALSAGAPGGDRYVDPEKKDLAYLATPAGTMPVPVSGGERARIYRGARAIKEPAVLPETLRIAPRPVTRDDADRIPGTIDARAPLPGAGQSVALGMGVKARVHPDATLSLAPPGDLYPAQMFALEGAALFVVPRDSTSHSTWPTYVRTRGGFVAASAPVAVRIHARGDTTDVRVLKLVQRGLEDPFTGQSAVMLYPSDMTLQRGQFILEPGQRGRLVRGKLPVIIPDP